MTVSPIFDVAIIGGGLAGCSVALSLARSNPSASFVLIDDADPTSFKIGESLPAIASRTLSYLSPSLFAQLTEDTRLGQHIHSTGTASAWSSREPHEQHAIMNPFGQGWHLDRSLFDETLRNACRQTAAASSGRSVVTLELFRGVHKDLSGLWRVSSQVPGAKVTDIRLAKWIVDATGRKASVAHKLGAGTMKSDSLLAFFAVFASSVSDSHPDLDHRTLIEATNSGWWYTSQLSHGTRVVSYHTDDSDPVSRLARTEEGFLALLADETEHVSGIITSCEYELAPGYPQRTAAGSSVLHPCSDEDMRWCAVGDAAMAFDPLSSQGMITALDMGCFVGDELAKRLRKDESGEEQGIQSIEERFKKIQDKYDKEKAYYYQQVKRFDGPFWARRQ